MCSPNGHPTAVLALGGGVVILDPVLVQALRIGEALQGLDHCPCVDGLLDDGAGGGAAVVSNHAVIPYPRISTETTHNVLVRRLPALRANDTLPTSITRTNEIEDGHE